MKLNNLELHEFLSSKNITHFFHANTVATSSFFIKAGGLLSRGDVEKMGGKQTEQSSDDLDKNFDVWFDIFLDTTDLHSFFSRQNHYGPVLFKINIDFLLDSDLDVYVTKNNPIYWSNSMKEEDRYFIDVQELSDSWATRKRQRMMFTIRKPGGPILFNSVEEVIIENPKVLIGEEKIDPLHEGIKILTASGLNRYSIRDCYNCFCESNYLNQVTVESIADKFLEINHTF
ncbi:hypothetical protein [Marinomonas fungiae]|uniref:Uncharacterized protein n=1 Tax=Marinomonas fungiae TaxID=1137284 RepID=A0A0K6IJN5_9GAMM|nr:hypothetical protein [Marinomonas fungiae]CUB03542.1 hypothetical protein Ga0061065_103393 [Marinomonas fungiae]